jgi:hypothetical protein
MNRQVPGGWSRRKVYDLAWVVGVCTVWAAVVAWVVFR